MIKCPKCYGYGQTVSTRNEENNVIRYHKCRECGFTFTSTQKTKNEESLFSAETIKETIDEFNFAVNKLFSAFNLYSANKFTDLSTDLMYLMNEFELVSNRFVDGYTGKECRFIIRLKAYKNKAEGVIRLCEIDDMDKTDTEIALLGFIKYDKEWSVDLDIPTINSITNRKVDSEEDFDDE